MARYRPPGAGAEAVLLWFQLPIRADFAGFGAEHGWLGRYSCRVRRALDGKDVINLVFGDDILLGHAQSRAARKDIKGELRHDLLIRAGFEQRAHRSEEHTS